MVNKYHYILLVAVYNVNKIEIMILRRMYAYRHIGNRHTSVDNLPKSFPKSERGNVGKAVKKLIRQNYIVRKPTGYGLHCSLNVQKIKEIENIVQDMED